MSKQTMEQRWKDVGMKHDDVAEVIHGGYRETAEALLPLIEKAVHGVRIDEAGRIQCLCHKRTSLCDRCERIRKLEAGE